jgi:hypothetical protein
MPGQSQDYQQPVQIRNSPTTQSQSAIQSSMLSASEIYQCCQRQRFRKLLTETEFGGKHMNGR